MIPANLSTQQDNLINSKFVMHFAKFWLHLSMKYCYHTYTPQTFPQYMILQGYAQLGFIFLASASGTLPCDIRLPVVSEMDLRGESSTLRDSEECSGGDWGLI